MEWKVPISDIDFDSQETEAVERVLASKWLSCGAVTAQFEDAFAKFVGAKRACALSSCTAALHLACHAAGIGPGDEVIVPSLTFVATANAVLYCGGTPVFADITNQDQWLLSADDVRAKVTPTTKAIIPVHYGGYVCDIDALRRIAEEFDLVLIEDAAHALGSYSHGKHAGSFGSMGCFSFFPNKNMTTAEGGMLITDDDGVADQVKQTRSHGLTTMTWDRHRGHAYTYDVPNFGFNYRIDEIRSAIGLVQLSKLPRLNQRRREIVKQYVDRLENIDELRIPFLKTIGETRDVLAYHLMPVLCKDRLTRDALMKHMKENGIQSSIHFPPVHLFTYYRKRFGKAEGQLPLTESVASRLVTLPLYPTLQEEQIQFCTDSIKNFFSRARS